MQILGVIEIDFGNEDALQTCIHAGAEVEIEGVRIPYGLVEHSSSPPTNIKSGNYPARGVNYERR